MANERVIKSRMVLEDKLEPHLEAMHRSILSYQPVMDSVSALARNSGIEEMQEKIRLLDRNLLGPRDQDAVLRAMEAVAGIGLPKLSEFTDHLKGLSFGPVADLMMGIADHRQMISDLMTPRPDYGEEIRSWMAFSELRGIGLALDNLPTFDKTLVAALRCDLGDWRDRIEWKPEVLLDSEARSGLYENLGFNKALTDFQSPVFVHNLDITGLRSAPPTLVSIYGDPLPRAKNVESGMGDTGTAFVWLTNFETQLRAFIDKKMVEACGSDWPRHRLPNGLHDEWQEKQRKDVESGKARMPLVCYADFTDYERVICRSDNWRKVFIRYFGRPESVRESLQRLYPIRLCVMHARPIGKDDELLLYVEVKRLGKVFIL